MLSNLSDGDIRLLRVFSKVLDAGRVSASHLHDAVNALNLQAPEVEISVHVTSPTELERAVLDGRFDLGFGACGRHSPYLTYEDVFEERQVLYCGQGHPLFERNREVGLA